MVKAFILITVKAGADEAIVEILRNSEKPQDIHEIYGAYDIIVQIEAPNDDVLKKAHARIASMSDVKIAEFIVVGKEWARKQQTP